MKKFNKRTFYEIYPSSFADSNNDGYGDLKGIIKHFDYIKGLGFDGIWLNPIFDSPFLDGGYDIRDYFKISPRFGTLEDLKALIKICKINDVLLLLDLVPGHTSIQNEMFIKSSEADPKEFKDRYIWNNCTWDLEQPYRWISGMRPRYANFMINFFAHQPALNYGFAKVKYNWQNKVDDEGPLATRKYIENVMKYYLNLGVDGFRVDMADSLVKDDDDKVETIKVWQDMIENVKKEFPDFVLVSEWSNPDQALKAGFTSDFILDHKNNCLNLLTRNEDNNTFPLLRQNDENRAKLYAEDFKKRFKSMIQYDANISWITGNHDTRRLASSLNLDEVRQALATVILMPGVPFIYAGDELGYRQIDDMPSLEGGYQRTGCRLPMKWENKKGYGFSKAKKIYLPFNQLDETVEDALLDDNSLYHFVKKLISIRKNYDDITSSDFHFLEDNLSFQRGKIQILLNNTNKEKEYISSNVLLSYKCKNDIGKIIVMPKGMAIIEVTK